jgi:DNA-binding transcriptional ArsR family regulator
MVAYGAFVDAVFKALADPTRRLILDELADRDRQTLFEICTRLTMKHGLSISRQGVTKHLGILEDAGLVVSEKQGRFKFHYLRSEPLVEVFQRWIDAAAKQQQKRELHP